MRILLFFLLTFAIDLFCHGDDTILRESQNEKMPQTLIQQFKEAAVSGELAKNLKEHATFNVKLQTLGGKVFWDSYRANGWELQVNTLSGWWRILNAEGVRVARGTTEEQLESLLNNRPTSIFGNYLEDGYRFARTPAKQHTGRTVVLLHGWGVRAYSMQELAVSLAQEGYDAYSYDYPTSACSLEAHCITFLDKFRELLASLPSNEEIYLLTHSMGGLVLRGAMAEMTETECRRISAIVMLGPPNKGSFLAYLGNIPLVNAFNTSLKDMTPDRYSFVSSIPAPPWLPPVGIIAGRFDGKVSLEVTYLPKPLSFKHTVVDCTHPGLRTPANVITQILQFYRTLDF